MTLEAIRELKVLALEYKAKTEKELQEILDHPCRFTIYSVCESNYPGSKLAAVNAVIEYLDMEERILIEKEDQQLNKRG